MAAQLFTSGENHGVIARRNRPLLDRKWYYRQLADVVLGKIKMTGTQMSALNRLAIAKGWNKPKVKTVGMPKQLRASQTPELTAGVVERLQNG